MRVHRKCRKGKHLRIYSGEAHVTPGFRSCRRKDCTWTERRPTFSHETEAPVNRTIIKTWETKDDFETENEVRVGVNGNAGVWGVPRVDAFTVDTMSRSA